MNRYRMLPNYRYYDVEGNFPLKFDKSVGKNLRNYEIYGNSVQDGTPSPDNPIEIQSVGDLTTKNLLLYPYVRTTATINGVTFTDNGDGSITINGTATANAIFYLTDTSSNYTLDRCGLKIGDSYTISKNLISGDGIANIYFIANYYNENDSMRGGATVSDLNTATATIQSDFVMWGIYLLVLKDKTVNNATIQLQLEKGSTATEYEPYHKYDLPITVTGKNLLKYPYYWTSRVRSGIMFTVNGDGTVTLNGTTTLSGTSIDDFSLANVVTIKSGTYTVSGCPEGGAVYKYRIFIHIRDSSGNPTYISDIGNGVTFTVTDTSTMTVSIRIGAEIGTVNNLVFAPQIELGSTATEYETYKGETTHIYLDEPLRKVGDYADYIDFKNQKIVRNVEVLDDTGTKTISESFGTLAAPTEESIALPALKTFKGTSIISADTTVLPSNIKVKYVRT